ncbi:hypothetical protein ABZX92_35370 [Lentzea sp. NPDC006480]|uniref:hypothetical protein n=1 Tax=Lentzea sp. NPDC006480 TaxID=3157176 RepID=UPI0033BE2C1C
MPPPLRELVWHLDVVVFDPPGLGRAGQRHADPFRPALSVYGFVRGSWAAQEKANRAYDASCREAAGPTYQHLTSWQMANDLAALRSALGQKRLRYLGNLYGISYGQAYLRQFGGRIDRMYRDHAHTMKAQLFRFRDWCAGPRSVC